MVIDQDVDQLYSLQIQATDKGTEEQKKGRINSIFIEQLSGFLDEKRG